MDPYEPDGSYEAPEIDPSLVLQKLRSGQSPLIVDVRTAAEFRKGHIPTSRSLPVDQICARIWEIESHRFTGTLVVVASRRGIRARAAAAVLRECGFDEIAILAGGLSRWEELGYVIEDTSIPPPPMSTRTQASSWPAEDIAFKG